MCIFRVLLFQLVEIDRADEIDPDPPVALHQFDKIVESGAAPDYNGVAYVQPP